MDTSPKPRGLTPARFFGLDLKDGSMTAAQLATGIAYSTIHHARKGAALSVSRARALETWSRGVAAAKEAGVFIDAALACGLVDEDADEDEGRPSLVA